MVKLGIETKKNEFEEVVVNDIELVVMGFTARNQEQMKKNLDALKKVGISIPNGFPQIYPCSNYLLTNDENIEVVTDTTCGEVEYLILKLNNNYYIGVGSDHADKELEKISIINSKQVCAKPFLNKFWNYKDIKDHWDKITLRSWQKLKNGDKILYQESNVDNILHPDDVIKKIEKYYNNKNCIIFSGSVANIIGEFIYGEKFIFEIEDPILERKMVGEYSVKNITDNIN